ncbi:MAG: hypothetical protein AB4911_09330 [Oscillochloridaceae bacterium umkhey_bin13]
MRYLSLILAVALLVGCTTNQPTAEPPPPLAPEATAIVIAPDTPASAPVNPPTGTDPVALEQAIQATLDAYVRAYSENDPDLLRTTVDQTNAPIRRLVQERFENYQGSALRRSGFPQLRVSAITPRELGFVQVQVDSIGGVRYDWLMREVDGRWVISEPTERELGERITIESENFTFYTYAWADPVNARLVELMEQARVQVGERLGALPEGKYNVYIRPIFGITPPASSGAIAWYTSAARPRGDRMDIYTPGSYVYSWYDANEGWEPDLYQTLVHEYTHLVNQRSFMPVATMRDWMYEGLAEYVSDSPRADEVSAAVRADRIIPILDPAGGTNPQDLDHLYLLERDRSLAYGLSYSLVAYIDQELGGLDTLWELARAFNETPGTGEARYDGALQRVFGLSFAEFDAGWRAWLRANY